MRQSGLNGSHDAYVDLCLRLFDPTVPLCSVVDPNVLDYSKLDLPEPSHCLLFYLDEDLTQTKMPTQLGKMGASSYFVPRQYKAHCVQDAAMLNKAKNLKHVSTEACFH